MKTFEMYHRTVEGLDVVLNQCVSEDGSFVYEIVGTFNGAEVVREQPKGYRDATNRVRKVLKELLEQYLPDRATKTAGMPKASMSAEEKVALAEKRLAEKAERAEQRANKREEQRKERAAKRAADKAAAKAAALQALKDMPAGEDANAVPASAEPTE